MIISTYNLFIILSFVLLVAGFYIQTKKTELNLKGINVTKGFVIICAALSMILFSILAYSSADIETDTCQKYNVTELQTNANQTDTVNECVEYQNVRDTGLMTLFSSLVLISMFLLWLGII